jgi:hypothetical protein
MAGLTFAAAAAIPDTFNVLLYGPPKAGKTSAAATAPGPILWLNMEGGGALGYARRVAAQRGTEIHEVRPQRHEKLKPVLEDIYRHVSTGAEPKVQTVVVDTLGKVRDHLARDIGGAHPQIQHWGEVAKVIEQFVVTMRDQPVNLILLAHEAVKDADDGDRIVEPLIGGATTAKVCGEVDVIAYCGRKEDEDGNVEYLGVLVERRGRRAGDRSGGLGASRPLDLTEWLDTYGKALASGAPLSREPAQPEPAADPEPEPVVEPITKKRAGEIVDAAWQVGVENQLQLAASHAHGADVGDCSTKTAAKEALGKLTGPQGDTVMKWLIRKADEQAAGSPDGERSEAAA